MSPEEAVERGVYERLKNDATLTVLLGSGVRVYMQWAADTLTESDFPRLTLYTFGPGPRGPDFQRVRVTLDEWVWRTGTSGGRAKLLAVDERIKDLLEQQAWTFSGFRLYATVAGWRDGEAANRLRRSREITVEASPLP